MFAMGLAAWNKTDEWMNSLWNYWKAPLSPCNNDDDDDDDDDETTNHRVLIDGYSGDAGNPLSAINGTQFISAYELLSTTTSMNLNTRTETVPTTDMALSVTIVYQRKTCSIVSLFHHRRQSCRQVRCGYCASSLMRDEIRRDLHGRPW